MLTDTGHDDTRSLRAGFLHHDFSHRPAVLLVQMAYRFVGQQEVERLHQSPDHGYTLLLTETHAAYRDMQLVTDAQRVEPSFYLFFFLNPVKLF